MYALLGLYKLRIWTESALAAQHPPNKDRSSTGLLDQMATGMVHPPSMYLQLTGCKLDNKEGRKLIEERNLSWKYPKVGKVITLSPDCQRILQSFNALKVNSPEIPEDTLLAEAVFAHNSKLKKGTKLSPFPYRNYDPPSQSAPGGGGLSDTFFCKKIVIPFSYHVRGERGFA